MKVGIVGSGMVGSAAAFALVMRGVGREIVVVVAAGVAQRPGETRLQLLERNAAVFADVVPAILAHALGAVLVVVSNEVLTWSQATIAGMRLDDFAEVHGTSLATGARERIDDEVRRAAYRIIAGKGATYYGIGGAVARLLEVLLLDQRAILTVCCRIASVPEYRDVTFALPQLVGGDGVLATIPLPLDPGEHAALGRSADVIRDTVAALRLA